MTTQPLTISNQSGSPLYAYVVDAGFSVKSTNRLVPGQNTIQVEQAPQMRIYFSRSASLFKTAGQEPIGWNTTTPFSFYEYTLNDSGFSADASYIDDWAYPVQTTILDSSRTGHQFGFLDASAIAMTLAAKKGNTFTTSAASGDGVGTTSDLFDAAHQRFAGPMRLWQQQVIMANAVQAGQQAYWPAIAPAGWVNFLRDVPYGPSPFGYPVSANASSLNDSGTYPEHGFDFSTNTQWTAMNGGNGASVQEPSGEKNYASNWNVWNYGYTTADPSADKPSPNYSFEANAYTQTLRAQAASEGAAGTLPDTAGTSPSAGNSSFVGFYTASKDDDYGTFTAAQISNVSLTVGALASKTIGTSNRDVIVGSRSDDIISGGYGADHLTGAPAENRSLNPLIDLLDHPRNLRSLLQSRLTRGSAEGGKDTYIYLQIDSSLHGRGKRDTITDFGAEDHIDLTRVDANSKRAGIQHFQWIGRRLFTGEAGQLRLDVGSPLQVYALLQGDSDGNGQVDFEVKLLGVTQLTETNLILT